jgi:hypothetical protein
MMRVSLTAEWVQGMADAMGLGFNILLDETTVVRFFAIGFVLNATLNILLMSSHVNTNLSSSCGNTDNVLFLCSNGCILSSSSDSDCA